MFPHLYCVINPKCVSIWLLIYETYLLDPDISSVAFAKRGAYKESGRGELVMETPCGAGSRGTLRANSMGGGGDNMSARTLLIDRRPAQPIGARDIPKVALLVETARSFGRDFLSGVARYARHHGPWIFHITPGDFEHDVPKMKQWGGSGIIARIPNERVAKAILEANLPTIALGLTDEQMQRGGPLAHLSEVSSDAGHVAQLATDHLLERQLKHFAYVGVEGRAWSRRRGEAFAQRLRAASYEPHMYPNPKQSRDRVWERELEIMAGWLRTLPLPIGLFACNDDRGRQVLEACRYAGLHVPEEVAVLGVDNDAVFCELADPPLSSIALNAETAGYRAAELLDGMMHGRITQPRKVSVEAIRVVTRRSTEVVAVADSDVAAALQFIRREKGRGLSVADVAAEVAVSRRHLERRFRETVGRTILEEIQLARIEHAKHLLLETKYPISKVAQLSGFGSTGYFVQFFHTRVGKTPRKFRVELTAER
jgi:LacI family transcriptional regulator